VNRFKLSRRTLLRGAGAAIALPVLDAMLTDGGLYHGRAGAAASAPPVRLVTYFWPNGPRLGLWAPTTVGEIRHEHLNACNKQAFAPVAGKPDVLPHMTFITGVGSKIWLSGHSCAMMAAGDGTTDDHNNFGNWPTGETIDQIAAAKLGGSSRMSSLVLSGSDGTTGNDIGFCAISWKAGRAVAQYRDPKQVFKALFGDGAVAPAGSPAAAAAAERAAKRRKSVLDFVKADGARLNARLGAADKERVDEHLSSIRELEKQIFAPASGGAAGSACGTLVASDFAPRNLGNNFQASDREPVLARLLVMALKCEVTRVASYMLDNASGQKAYPGSPGGDHNLSHDAADDVIVTRTNVKLGYFAEFLRQAAAVKEGDRTLLDNMIVYCNSEVQDGKTHGRDKLPIILAGGAGGQLKGGRHLKFDGGVLNDVLSSVLNYAGVPTGKFGSVGTGPLPGV
jgi:hypothetical protein